MSTKKNKKLSVKIERFRGICSDAPKGGSFVTEDIQNFRINADGSLAKRCGLVPILTATSPITASIVVRTNKGVGMFMLREYTVYHLNLKNMDYTKVGTISGPPQDARFFFYRGVLYLICTYGLYVVEEKKIYPTVGYIPLLGKDWKNNEIGTIHEPRSVLHNQARISYVMGDPPSIYLHAPYPIKEIHSILRNGEPMPTDRYELDERFNTVNVFDAKPGDRFVVHLSFEDEPERKTSALMSCIQSLICSNTDSSRLLLFGGNLPATVFCSAHVSEESLKESMIFYPESTAAYFPEGSEILIGDGLFRIQAATMGGDQILIFTTGTTWISQNIPSNSELLTTRGVYDIGCACPMGAIVAGSVPISVGTNTIYRWDSGPDGTYRPVSISQAVDSHFEIGFLDRAQLCYDPSKNELWVNDPEKGVAWIYRMESGDWFKYTFPSRCVVWLDNRMGVIYKGDIYVFDPTAKTDLLRDGAEKPVSATYSASLGDLGDESVKTLSHLVFHGYTEGTPLTLMIWGKDLYDPIILHLGEEPERTYSVIRKRCPSGRFRQANIYMEATRSSYPVIHSLSVHTK